MRKIHVTASKGYDVIIGGNILEQIGSYAGKIRSNCKVAIISDSNVWTLYGRIVSNSLRNEGFTVLHYVFSAGEQSKNGVNYLQILSFLAEKQLTRSDLIIALGGGVAGDMAGFVAATYLRGVSYIQVPTTLLAMVDSSVGGKTAIDLPAGKNLAGAFYQPALVLADIEVLRTLPDDIFRDGCAEVIKYGVLYDRQLFDHLASVGLSFDRETVVARCVELKRNVVADDEFDNGSRQKLNLGHTIGHGVEVHSDFQISHGKAVAIGMAIITKAASKTGICHTDVYLRMTEVLGAFGLPTRTTFTAEQLFSASLSDKKRSGETVNLIVPREIGNCIIRPTPVEELESFIKAGL